VSTVSLAKELQAAKDEVVELRRSNVTLSRQLERSKRKTDDLVMAVYQAAKDASVGAPRRPTKPPAKDVRTRGVEWALLHCSDWQVGKRTATFSTEVAAKRITELGRVAVQLAEIERGDHPVPNIGVMLGGDMVEGTNIFPGQVWEVDSTLYRQLFATVEIVTALLVHLLGNFDTVEVWEEAGNHGRLGKKGEYDAGDNIDRMLYRIVQDRLSHETRLKWHHSESWHQMVNIGNYKALLVHGDEVKSFGGQTPAFGIIKKVNGWATGVLPEFTDCFMGHFHQPLVLPIANGKGRTFVNASIESDSVYAKEFMAATGTPGQRLVFVTPRKGRITGEHLIWLD
jgi:hypothetical protein